MSDLPLGLRHAIESGECVLFVGAGIGAHLKGPDGSPAPDGSALAQQLCEVFSIQTDSNDLAKVAQVVELHEGRPELEAFLQKRLANLEPDETVKWLVSCRWKAIFTTNYDLTLERAYDLLPNPQQKPVTISATSDIVPFNLNFEVPIYHLHGTLFGSQKARIVITEQDYARFRERRKMLFELLKNEFATSTMLYLGYSNRDPNWKLVLFELQSEFSPSAPPHSYRVSKSTDPLDDEILKSQGIDTINCTIEEFCQSASLVLSSTRIDPERLKRIRYKIPPDLSEAFEKNPAPTARLTSSWTYVNQAPFDVASNLELFLSGDKCNWGVIGRGQYFERDIEEQIYEEVLDYATSSSRRPKAFIVLGPAGYGISTLLMSIAARLIKERAGYVFMHSDNAPLTEGDIEYAISISPSLPFFFIDNAADNFTRLNTVIQSLRDSKVPACFILGERLNEWRQSGRGIGGDEFIVEALSDPEISRLLNFLQQNNALGKLRDLDEPLRFAAIKQKHNKELLVAMKEATEGLQFDAIIENEYRGLGNELSRTLYLAVACLHQHGAFVRDTLLADIFETPIEALYAQTGDATEGVIIFESQQDGYSHSLARTRHRIIAQVLWERVGVLAEREHLLMSILAKLNFSYRSDRESFDHLIKSERTIDSIRTLEGKIQFFELACKKDPDNPYVKQHYARMLMRQEKAELALGQIDAALKLDPNARILHHTRGVVLRALALGVESVDIARRRLAQSEAAFRRCIAIYHRDEYAYQALAQLYLDWAKRAPSEEEAATYIAKTEEIITEGLKVVRVRDGLWVVSADVQRWLGDQPSHLAALERAVAETPGSIIARYLLGRSYRKAGKLQEAKDVLSKVITQHPEEFRACVEYGLVLHELGEPYSKSIAALRFGSLFGLSDPRFVAVLGGMLFMNSEFSEARIVFGESAKREFPGNEAQKIQFRPKNPKDRTQNIRLRGKVVLQRLGYAFIEVPGYERFLCPGSKFRDIRMAQGLELMFEPAFCSKGAIADNISTL